MAKLLKELGVKALFPMIHALAQAGADEDFAKWACQPENAKALLDWYGSRTTPPVTDAPDIRDLVTVPELPTLTFVKQVEERLRLTHLDADFLTQEFIRDERGKTFEARLWTPDYKVRPATHVRRGFAKEGFFGSTAAFLAWLVKHHRLGSFASIPENGRLFRSGKVWAAPEAFRNMDNRLLALSKDVRSEWNSGVTYVGFREVKTPWVNP